MKCIYLRQMPKGWICLLFRGKSDQTISIDPMKLNLQNISLLCILLAMVVTVMILAKAIIAPIIFAILITLCLIPICNFLESKKVNRLLAVVLTLLGFILILTGLIITVSVIFSNIFQDLPRITDRLQQGLNTLKELVENNFGFLDLNIQDRLEENASRIISYIFSLVENSISSSLAAIGNFFLTLIYIFFLLTYRKGMKNILLGKKDTDRRSNMMSEVQATIQQYVFGLFIVILILGCLNSFGLWIIGIDYFLFWGFLAAGLIIIPYIGTTIGGIFPFLYALATTDTVWQPVAIVILYYTIQQIEGNFITPNIIGSKIDVNPLVVIFSMIVGGFLWGIAGLILALPLIGVLRIILNYFDETRPLGDLMGNRLT